jgi:hypothetical protein
MLILHLVDRRTRKNFDRGHTERTLSLAETGAIVGQIVSRCVVIRFTLERQIVTRWLRS